MTFAFPDHVEEKSTRQAATTDTATKVANTKWSLSHRPRFFCGSPHDLKNAGHLVYITDARKQRSAAHQLCEDAPDLLLVEVPIVRAARDGQKHMFSPESSRVKISASLWMPGTYPQQQRQVVSTSYAKSGTCRHSSKIPGFLESASIGQGIFR